jgi:hypothetical protein
MNNDRFSIEALQIQAEIYQVIAEHIRGVDRKDWDLVRSGFHHDAIQDHGSYCGDIGGLIDWISSKHTTVSHDAMHHLGTVHIDLYGTRAIAESSFLSFETIDVEGKMTPTVTGARWIDRFESRDSGPWLIAKRLVVVHFTRTFDDPRDLVMPGALRPSRSHDDPYYSVVSELEAS